MDAHFLCLVRDIASWPTVYRILLLIQYLLNHTDEEHYVFVFRALRRQDFNTEKIRTTRNGMKNCGKLRQKCCR